MTKAKQTEKRWKLDSFTEEFSALQSLNKLISKYDPNREIYIKYIHKYIMHLPYLDLFRVVGTKTSWLHFMDELRDFQE